MQKIKVASFSLDVTFAYRTWKHKPLKAPKNNIL